MSESWGTTIGLRKVKEILTLLSRERSKARLAVDARENMEGELLWPFHTDALSCAIRADRVVVLWAS